MRKRGYSLTAEQKERIHEMCEKGISGQKISDKIGVSKATVCNYLKSAGLRSATPQPKPIKRLPENVDFATLDSEVLFNPKLFPVF